MSNSKSFALLAVLTLAGAMTMSSAYALEQAYPGMDGDVRETAKQMVLDDIPISVWTDQTSYDHDSMIQVSGIVANKITGIPVTLTVTNPMNSVVTIDQIDVNADGSFGTAISTASELWKYNGTYAIKVNYGSAEKNNKVLVELTGGVNYMPPDAMPGPDGCNSGEVAAAVDADTYCIPFSITGGSVTGAAINMKDNSIVFQISADDDGVLKLNPSTDVIDGVFMTLVDGEEWDDAYYYDDGTIKVKFLAGAENVEIIGTYVIPEFGTIAAMVLAVAIISIIAVTARSRLSVMPRY